MKEKLIGILTALCMVISPSFALAADVTTKVDEDIELMYEQVIEYVSRSKYLNVWTGNMFWRRQRKTRRSNVKLTIELLKMENYSWKSIKSWVHTGSGVVGVNESETYWVDHGTYTTKITAYVTDSNGNYIESPSTTSVIKEY